MGEYVPEVAMLLKKHCWVLAKNDAPTEGKCVHEYKREGMERWTWEEEDIEDTPRWARGLPSSSSSSSEHCVDQPISLMHVNVQGLPASSTTPLDALQTTH